MAAYHVVIWWCIAVLISTATAVAATTYPFATATATARLRTTCTLALERSQVAGSSEVAFEANCTGETLVVALGRGVVMTRRPLGVKIVDQDACTLDLDHVSNYRQWTCAVSLCAGTSAELYSSTSILTASDVGNWRNATVDTVHRYYQDIALGMICGQHITVALYGMTVSIETTDDNVRVAAIVLLSSNVTLVNSSVTGGIDADTCNITVVDCDLSGAVGISSRSSNLSVVDSNISGDITDDALFFNYACVVRMVGNSISTSRQFGVKVYRCNVTMANNTVAGYVILTGAPVSKPTTCNAALDGNSVLGEFEAYRCNVTMLNGNVSGNSTLTECNATMVNNTVGIIFVVFASTGSAPTALINLSTCTVSEASASLPAIHTYPGVGTDWVYYMNSLCENPELQACFALPRRVALLCAGVNQKYTSYHSARDTCLEPRWLVNVVLVYVLFGVAVMSILACAIICRRARGSHYIAQTGRSYGDCAYISFIWAGVKNVGARVSKNVHPHVAHLMQMLVPILRIALMVWDIVTDAVVMDKIFEWSGGVDEWVDSRLSRASYMPVKVGASDAIVGSFVVLYFVPYILASLILHVRVTALVASLKDDVIRAYPSLLPFELHATLNPWLWILLWWYALIFWLLYSLLMDIPMMVLHTVSAGHWFAWLQLANYFNLHSFLAAAIRAPYSAGLVTYVYATGISAEQPIEVSSTLFWLGVGSSLLHILYWVGRFILTAMAAWPDTSVHRLLKDMFVNLVVSDKVQTITASRPA